MGEDVLGAAKAAAGAAHMSEAVILRALFGIAQNVVGFRSFLEFLFRFGVARIAIRMILHRQLAIGFLDLFLAGRTLDPENFIIVACHAISRWALVCWSRLTLEHFSV